MFGKHAFASGTPSTEEIALRIEMPTPQNVVRDAVVFKPPANPYAGIEQASKRLSLGESVFAPAQLPKAK